MTEQTLADYTLGYMRYELETETSGARSAADDIKVIEAITEKLWDLNSFPLGATKRDYRVAIQKYLLLWLDDMEADARDAYEGGARDES